MLGRIFMLELGNDKGLRSFKNVIKLFLTYILPNTAAVIAAGALGIQSFYHPKDMLLFVVGLNVSVTIIVQYISQRHIFGTLENEALLTFIPTKVASFVMRRLFFFFTKAYVPVLIFSVVFLSYFVPGNGLLFMITFVTSVVIIVYFQVYLAMMIRYVTNTMNAVLLQTFQVVFFSLSFMYLLFFWMLSGIYVLETLEDYFDGAIMPAIQVNPFYFSILMMIVAMIAFCFMLCIKRVHITTLIPNRNLSLNLPTARMEQLFQRLYGAGLSDVQTLLFAKDIKDVFRNSKVLITTFGLYHVINMVFMSVFFFLSLRTDPGLFIAKFYLGWILGLLVFVFLLSAGYKDILDIRHDEDVLKSYHIPLSKLEVILAKTNVLRAFISPKITSMYVVFIVSLLIMNAYTLAAIFLFNYLQCFLWRKIFELWRVKQANDKMFRGHVMFSVVNVMLILVSVYVLLQLFSSTPAHGFLFQSMFLGATLLLYVFNVMMFKHMLINEGGDKYA
ncbi:hypothetical protein [Lentibacillus saliphilus]|uniref:hypothetical protein n=1 Tax=Lentibacillus saliphilus TaxID=2737028 RepID=UPI001C304B66|nr:hypothetical protein [Lentibacillus saliphilus]